MRAAAEQTGVSGLPAQVSVVSLRRKRHGPQTLDVIDGTYVRLTARRRLFVIDGTYALCTRFCTARRHHALKEPGKCCSIQNRAPDNGVQHHAYALPGMASRGAGVTG